MHICKLVGEFNPPSNVQWTEKENFLGIYDAWIVDDQITCPIMSLFLLDRSLFGDRKYLVLFTCASYTTISASLRAKLGLNQCL